jgi:hypothetical protein
MIRFVRCSAALLVAWLGLSAAGATTMMRYHPDLPAAGMPFEVVLGSSYPFELIEQVAQDGLVRLVTTPVPTATSDEVIRYSLTVTLGPFEMPPTGYFDLEWVTRQPDGSVTPAAPRRRVSLRGHLDLGVPARIHDFDTFRVDVSGVAQCPQLEDFVEVEGDTIVLPYSEYCMLTPGPPEYFEAQSAPIGPLAAGEYRVVIREDGPRHVPLAETRFSVLPDVVRLQGDRFQIDLYWSQYEAQGRGKLVRAPGPDSALYYFFDPTNWEFMVKVLDGCAINGQFWVFGAASTNVGYTLLVRDTLHPELPPKAYTNNTGTNAPAINDTAAFACSEVQP